MLTRGIEKRVLPCGCRMSWKVCPKPCNDYVRVDVVAGCPMGNHREEMTKPWRARS